MKEGYTRVTTILNPFSGYCSIPEFILQQASERGIAIHESCDAIIEGFEPDELKPTWQKYVESFNLWHIGKGFIQKPERFYCDGYKITGECDAIYVDQGKLVLVDFKTSSNVNRTWPIQGSAYSYLANLNGFKIRRIEFIKLDKNGNYPEIFTYEEDFGRFLACLEIYNEFFKDLKPIIDTDDI